MTRLCFLFLLLFYACAPKKGLNAYVGHKKDFLLQREGAPSSVRTDTTGEETITYRVPRKVHHPKYDAVTRVTTFFLNKEGVVYKWSRTTYKSPPPTPKPGLAID